MRTHQKIAALQIHALDWFEREEMQDLIDGDDLFLTYHAGAPNSNDLPQDIHDEIVALCQANGIEHGIVRLLPFEP